MLDGTVRINGASGPMDVTRKKQLRSTCRAKRRQVTENRRASRAIDADEVQAGIPSRARGLARWGLIGTPAAGLNNQKWPVRSEHDRALLDGK